MAEVLGVNRLRDVLARRLAVSQRQGRVVVRVGFTAAYALYVHENLQAIHPVGQAKFLEEPARTMVPQLAGVIRMALKTGKTLEVALLLAGLLLQREAQMRCPVDTGNLRQSAFTILE